MITERKIYNNEIELRNLSPSDDLGHYLLWLKDDEINQFLEVRFSLPEDETKISSYVSSVNTSKDTFLFGIFHTREKIHIGNIKLGPINWNHLTAEIGILIGEKSYWGRGYASEAISLLSDFAFNEIKLKKLTAGCYEQNIGSFKAFLKEGFIEEGRLKSQWLYNEKRYDGVILGKVKE